MSFSSAGDQRISDFIPHYTCNKRYTAGPDDYDYDDQDDAVCTMYMHMVHHQGVADTCTYELRHSDRSCCDSSDGVLPFVVAMPKFRVMQTLVDALNAVSREILTGIQVIRAFGREDTEEKRFDRANMNLYRNQLFVNRTMISMSPLLMIIMYGLSIWITWVAAGRIDMGQLQVGTMTAFIAYSMEIVFSFLMIASMAIFLPRAGIAADRIYEVINTESSIKDREGAGDIAAETDGTVRFEHVSFRYPDAEEDVLTDIDFEARPGETTAIIGSTGCGKTTLISLIPRFYDVTEGRVTVGGKDVRGM